MKTAARDLQALFDLGALGGLTDAQWLDRFVARREDTAFEELVRRNGPLVWGVCRRILRNHHDAEDAFQATFLVLARKAHTIFPRERLVPWLYGVAYHISIKARARAARRTSRERHALEMVSPEVGGQDLARDLAPILDRELHRLPERYRIPIVLCDLEGKTRQQAARELGWPEGTVSSRLSRGRGLLATRLSRRGLGLSGGVLASLLSDPAVSAQMPNSLVATTVNLAIRSAGRTLSLGLDAFQVALAVERTRTTMGLIRIIGAVFASLIIGLIGVGLADAPPASKGDDARAKPTMAPMTDMGRLQGVWEETSLIEDGGNMPPRNVEGRRLVIEDNAIREERGEKAVAEVTFRLDESQNPRAIDVSYVQPYWRNRSWPGIYSLEGDTLTYCFAVSGKDRPSEFSSEPGSRRRKLVFKRSAPHRESGRQARSIGGRTEDALSDALRRHDLESVTGAGSPTRRRRVPAMPKPARCQGRRSQAP